MTYMDTYIPYFSKHDVQGYTGDILYHVLVTFKFIKYKIMCSYIKFTLVQKRNAKYYAE